MVEATHKALRQVTVMLPVLLGVILLVGLIQTYLSRAWMSSLFTGHPLSDSMVGAVFGSVFAGNPVNGYVVAEALLGVGVGLVGVTALIVTWVTVGVVQLPAEAAALGLRFALVRAAVAFALSIPIACLTVWLVGILL